MNKPVTVKDRNTSRNDFLGEMIRLKNELSAIGNNFNQFVKKLHALERIPEFRAWILINEADKDKFTKKVDEIREKWPGYTIQWLMKDHSKKEKKDRKNNGLISRSTKPGSQTVRHKTVQNKS